MADTLLSIVQKVCGRLGLDKPGGIVGSSDYVASQMLDLANEEGEELSKVHTWSALTIEGATLSLVAGQEAYALPADFARVVTNTQWDRTNRWRTDGPDSPQTARWRRESPEAGVGPRRALRQSGTNMLVFPVPTTTGDLLAYDYVSANWVMSGGASAASWQADADTPLLPSHLFVQGLRWRWLLAKGMECTAYQSAYAADVRRAIAHDMGGGRVLNLSPSRMEEATATTSLRPATWASCSRPRPAPSSRWTDRCPSTDPAFSVGCNPGSRVRRRATTSARPSSMRTARMSRPASRTA